MFGEAPPRPQPERCSAQSTEEHEWGDVVFHHRFDDADVIHAAFVLVDPEDGSDDDLQRDGLRGISGIDHISDPPGGHFALHRRGHQVGVTTDAFAVQRGQEAGALTLVWIAVEQNDRPRADHRFDGVGHRRRERRCRHAEELPHRGSPAGEQHRPHSWNRHPKSVALLGSPPKVSLGVIPGSEAVGHREAGPGRLRQIPSMGICFPAQPERHR